MPLDPPVGRLDGYTSFESLISDVNRHAKDEGYAIVKRRAGSYKDGIPRRYDLVCDRGGV